MGKKLTVERFRKRDSDTWKTGSKKRPLLRRLLTWGIAIVVLILILSVLFPLPFSHTDAKVRPHITIFPKHLVQTEILVNNKRMFVENRGKLHVYPNDRIRIDKIITDGIIPWGIKLISDGFPAEALTKKSLRLIDFWPLNFFKEPHNIKITFLAWGNPIGEITIVGKLSFQDWLKLAEETENLETRIFYLEQAASAPSRSIFVNLKLARLYEEKGDWENAAKIYEDIASTSDSKEILKKLLDAYIKSNQVDKAIETYLAVLKKEPKVETLSEFFSYLQKHRKPYQIVKILNKNSYRITTSLKAPFYAYLGSLEANLHRWKPATIHLEKAISLGAKDPDVYYNLSIAYKELGAYGLAKKYLKRYLKKKPNDNESQLLLTQLLQQEGEQQEAINQLRKLIDKDPKNLNLHLQLVKLLEKTGNKPELIKEYEKLVSLDPQNRVAWYNLGVLYYEQKAWEKAENSFKKAINLKPDDSDTKSFLAQVLIQQEKYKEAVPLLKDLIVQKQENESYYDQLFTAYSKTKDYASMEKDFREAIKKHPDNQKFYRYVIYAMLKTRNIKGALRYYEKLIKIAPKNEKYLKEAAAFYEKHGYYTEALKTLSRLLELNPDDQEAQEAYLRVKMKDLKIKQGKM